VWTVVFKWAVKNVLMEENLKLCMSDKFDMGVITVDIINNKFCTEYNKPTSEGQ
jgi:hypothetical protein